MTPSEILIKAECDGIALWAKADKLHYRTRSGRLPEQLRSLLRDHKPALLKLLSHRNPPRITAADQDNRKDAGQEHASIRKSDGHQDREEAKAAAEQARRVYQYRLTTASGWNILIAPGWNLEDAERDLRQRFGTRLVEVIKHRPAVLGVNHG